MEFYNRTGGNATYNYNPYNITITETNMQTYTKTSPSHKKQTGPQHYKQNKNKAIIGLE